MKIGFRDIVGSIMILAGGIVTIIGTILIIAYQMENIDKTQLRVFVDLMPYSLMPSIGVTTIVIGIFLVGGKSIFLPWCPYD